MKMFYLLILYGTMYATLFAEINTENTLTDIDNNQYKTVKIGNQIWMAENLKTTHYIDGTEIPEITTPEGWEFTKNGAFCYLNNNPKNNDKSGKLYNWFAVETGKLAPKGWHIPTVNEVNVLIEYLGKETAGAQMKASPKSWYQKDKRLATNTSGFNAIPGGFRNEFNAFDFPNFTAIFWTSDVYVDKPEDVGVYARNGKYAWSYSLFYAFSHVSINDYQKMCGYSVRCIKD
ncbi:MAG: fibrobacter succinogenes major paralogous domain-containing protein [Chitinophagales bacterium]|nr:fibrobacter succinogenes major paralogous domain-containing protein [Chitinophagales bacterium]